MLLPRMDLLSHRFMDKMNNNIGRLHYDAYDDDSGDSRMHALSSSVGNNRTGTPVSPSKRKFEDGEQVGNRHDYDNEQMTKMSRLITTHLGTPANGDSRQDTWSHCNSSFEHTSSVISGFHANRLYVPFPVFAVEQPIALTKNSVDGVRSALPPPPATTERQQNRPSVITCAPASNRTCNLSNCHMSPNGCTSVAPAAKNKPNEEHFRRSLGDIYQEPGAASNSVSITGSVDDHFAQALGDTWLQIKAKGSGSRSPESTS
ncbi:transcription cofactor vestigial-like protein 4 isoform X2 [Brachyhypopomus gauderio]|uniref:transcription cofactor vestigial-like protein 4 isoform X2 n=1 Tax=Brachyhypopomus gauderio TaxID=698409 RepID=UPI004041DF84